MPKLPEPCLVCGRLTNGGSRCDLHRIELEQRLEASRRERKRNTGQYSGNYSRLAKIIRQTGTHCHICKKPFEPNDKIEADHLYPGTPVTHLQQLAPAHARCNQSRGNKPLDGRL